MTITLDTPLLGPVDTTPVLLIPAFSGHAYDDATVAAFATALVKWSAVFGIRASILAAQIAKETGFFRFGGQVQPSQFNMAGLGATNGGAAGASYPDIDTGVCAVCVHWMAYVYGDVAQWPAGVRQYQHLDDRYSAVLSTGHAGKITTLATVTNGVWAYSKQYPVGSLDNGYATGIVSIANSIGGTPVSAVPTEADLGYPGRVHYATGSGEAMDIANVQWFIIHDTEGGFAGSEATLSGQISAHLLIDKSGEWRFMVPLDTVAYSAGNLPVNRQSVNVEHVGFADARDGGYTDPQYRCCAAFFRFCRANGMTNVPAVYIGKVDADGGPEPDVAGILGHMDVPRDDGKPGWGGNYDHTDPGPTYDFEKLKAYIGNAPPPPPTGHQIDGHTVGDGHYTLYTSVDEAHRLIVFGKCLTDEHDEYMVIDAPADAKAKNLNKIAVPVVAVRYERQVAIWDRGRTAAPWDTRIPLTGEHVGPADDLLVGATLYAMQLVGYTP